MNKKVFRKLIAPYLRVDMAVLAVFAVALLWYRLPVGIAALCSLVALQILHAWITEKVTGEKLADYEEVMAMEHEGLAKVLTGSGPNPLCVVGIDGEIYWKNLRFSAMFETAEEFYSEVDKANIISMFDAGEENNRRKIRAKGRIYSVYAADMPAYGMERKMLFWLDITDYEEAALSCSFGQPCIAYINVDNYDELIASSPVEVQSTIAASIDRLIRTWAADVKASITQIRNHRYVMFFEKGHLESIITEKFPILTDIRSIETEADFPTSLSIGIGVDADSPSDIQGFASDALDLALGRGGDQAVIKRGPSDIEFYGGAMNIFESRNKGRSRIMVHALQQLIKASSNVYIMGHKRPDMDSFGAAVGIAAIVRNMDKESYIVLDDVDEAIDAIYEAAVETGSYEFITADKACESVREDTLLVVVDTHIPGLTECPLLLDKVSKVAVIDHHRRSKTSIESPTLAYTEVFASSTCELVTEMIQYSGTKFELSKFEAEALLAGITVDTKNFTVNTGVRTFEAAAWLRRRGADNYNVRNFFRMRLDFFQKKVNMIASAEILANGVAIAYTKESDPAMQVLVSQTADELLEMKGVVASFVAGSGKELTMLSGRSYGKINVQTILEKLGGGGHLTTAGVQLEASPEEAIQLVVKTMRDMELL